MKADGEVLSIDTLYLRRECASLVVSQPRYLLKSHSQLHHYPCLSLSFGCSISRSTQG